MSDVKTYKDIVSCWHKIEFFTPYEINAKQFEICSPQKTPWIDRKVNNNDFSSNSSIQYKVFLGVFPVKNATDTIRTYLGDKNKEVDYIRQRTCLGEMHIDTEGNYIEGSLNLSSMPWAIGQLLNNNLHSDKWINDFNRYIENVKLIVKDNFYNKCTYNALLKTVSDIIELIKWTPDFYRYSILFTTEKSVSTSKKSKNKDEDEIGILNSFYVSDLEKIIKSLDEKNYGKALEQYLSPVDISNRIDLLSNIDEAKKLLSASNIPFSRWPSKNSHSLSLMQQTAVNLILNKLSHSPGIFSVNGPPGTGKTTLLRDVISSIIFNRALKLCSYKNPGDAFTPIRKVSINSHEYNIYKPDEVICQDSIIVASSNNGAVKNISEELPKLNAIDGQYYTNEGALYFRGIANKVFEDDCWGMIAAVLGNSTNRFDFNRKFWFDKKEKDYEVLGMMNYLKNSTCTLRDWEESKQSFDNACNKVNNIIKSRAEAEETLAKINDIKTKIINVDNEIQNINNQMKKLKITQQELMLNLARKKDNLNECRENIKIAKLSRPWGIFSCINSAYKKSMKKFLEKLDYTSEEVERFNADIILYDSKINNTDNVLHSLLQKKYSIQTTLISYTAQIHKIKNELKGNFPDDNFWNQSENSLQTSCPWMDEVINEARSELLLEALKIHRIFIENASSKIKNNLAGFINLMGNNLSVYENSDIVKSLWDTLFLVIPVISTTFASVSSMMKGLQSESIGWLFIDEAGQAIPQAAAGAIWRAKRVVAVGDPIQIPPVVTIPESIINDLRSFYKIPNELVKKDASVQTLSDMSNTYGAYIHTNNERQWVGCPLRVHRRCIEPMFSVANDIAYAGIMVQATIQPNKEFILGESRWIDVEGMSSPKHWVPIQGKVIVELISKAIKHMPEKEWQPNLYIISPFKTVIFHLKRCIFRMIKEIRPDIRDSEIYTWMNNSIGTIHTFQGKEVDTVILCLGVDENSKGAAQWAASSPNMLNVAVTRARYRFIVVGSRNLWGGLPYFQSLSSLPVVCGKVQLES